jgi:riboflavin transporter FmnP
MNTTKNSQKIRRMVIIGMFAAMAYVAMLVIHIKVSFLTLDVKDAVITLCGLYFGPLSALFISVLVPLVELITVSDSGLYGLIMNIISSVAFSVTASLIYKWKKSFYGAILALASAAFVVTGIMMLANLVVTPYFMGVDIATVRGMIPTLLLPFNFTKAVLNAGVVLALYKPLVTALRAAKLLPKSENASGKQSFWSIRSLVFILIAIVLISASIIYMIFGLGGSFEL